MEGKQSVDQQWNDEFDRWTPRRVKTWVAIIVALFLLGGIGVWGFNVVTSGAKGTGDQIVKNNEEVNRTGQQQEFEQLYADIQGYKTKIANAKEAASSNNDSADQARLNMVVTGTKNVCVDTVQQYNANTHKVLAANWKDARLPYEITPNDYCS